MSPFSANPQPFRRPALCPRCPMAWLGAVLFLLPFSPLRAQDSVDGSTRAAAEEVFGEVVDVELVNARVWVSDRQGQPVTGLRAEDFTVKLDGEPVTLTHFSESRSGTVSLPAAELPAAELPDAGLQAAKPQAAGSAQNLAPDVGGRFVIYVDELHLGALDRRQVIEDLRQFVADHQLAPADLLILQQVEDLRRILPFGSSARDADQALEGLLQPPGRQGRASLEKKLTVDRLWQLWEEARQLADRDPCGFFARGAEQEAVSYAQRAALRGRTTLRHLEEVSTFLAGLEGFKALLYVGDVLEVRPGEDLLDIVRGLCPQEVEALPADLASEELSRRFDQVAQRANAGRVTLYTLQAGGLSSGRFTGPNQRSSDLRVSSTFDRALRQSDRGGLEQLALQTGGEAIVDRNRFAVALGEVAQDLETFYSLGFPPPESRAGSDLRLEIDVRGDGLRLRHRDRIQLRSPQRQMYEQVMSAIHLGESHNPLGVRLASGSLREESGGNLTLPLFVRVPADRVVFLPTQGEDVAEIEVMVAARSPEHRGTPPTTRTFRLQRPAATAPLLDLALELQLAPGAYIIGFGVRDRAAATTSFLSTSIAISSPDAP